MSDLALNDPNQSLKLHPIFGALGIAGATAPGRVFTDTLGNGQGSWQAGGGGVWNGTFNGLASSITATQNVVNALALVLNGGVASSLLLENLTGTGAGSIQVTSTLGGIDQLAGTDWIATAGLGNATLVSTNGNAVLSAPLGFAQVESVNGQVVLLSGQNGPDAVTLQATNAGGSIDLQSNGAIGNSILLNAINVNPLTTINVTSAGTGVNAINLNSGGGIALNAVGAIVFPKLTLATGAYGAGWVWTDPAGNGLGAWVAAVGGAWNGIFNGVQSTITSSLNATNAILLHITGGVSSEMNLINDAGTGTGLNTSAINILASAGDISITAQPFGEVIFGSYVNASAGFIGPPSANFAFAQNGAMIGQGLSLGVTSWAGGTYGVVLAGGPFALTLPPVSAVVNGVELTLFVAGISNAVGNDCTVTCGGGDYEGVLVRGAAAGVESLNGRTVVTFHDDAPGTGAQIGDQITFRCTGLKWVYSGVASNVIGMVVS